MLLYKKIKEYLSSEIEKKEPGSILPSQSLLMKKFNVCHLTVRKAFDELEKEGWIFKKQGKGTFVRKRIETDYSNKILVVVPPTWKTDFCNGLPFMEKLIDESVEKDIHIHIFPFKRRYSEIIRFVETQKFSGVIWLMPWEKDLPALEEIFEKGCHVMLINRIFSNTGFIYVSTDHEMGAYNATIYLIKKGHKRIGFVGYIETSHIIQRYTGFSRALKEFGMTPLEAGIVKVLIDEAQDNRIEGRQQDFEKMLLSYKPTSIFVSGLSFLLNVVLPVLREKNIHIPQDLEVITYDEIPESIPEKADIHEIVQPFYEMGKISIERINDILKGHYSATKIILQPGVSIKERDKNLLTLAEVKQI